MSPFLYFLVAEAMRRNLHHLQEFGDLKGSNIARGVKASNHAQFADDTILLGGASITISQRFKCTLSNFLRVIDGKVNSTKSKVYGWNCPLENVGKYSHDPWIQSKRNMEFLQLPGDPNLQRGKKGLLTGKG